jgi:hypothetical protein
MLVVSKSISFDELYSAIQAKFKIKQDIVLEYKDEDGEYVVIGDDDDLEVAIYTEESLGRRQIDLKVRIDK